MAVYHCSADRVGTLDDKGAEHLDRIAKERGFRKISYHIVVKTNGEIEFGRDFNEIGAHAKGFNTGSIGICYIGGLDGKGEPADTRTFEQKETLKELRKWLDWLFPGIEHVGHRDLSADLNGDGKITPNEWMKQCPCYYV